MHSFASRPGSVLCPGPMRKVRTGKRSLGESDIDQLDLREEDFQKGVMVSDYDVHLHVAIASLRVIDGAGQPTVDGRKPLDFFAGKGKPRCALFELMAHAPSLTFCMRTGVFCQEIVKNRISFGSLR